MKKVTVQEQVERDTQALMNRIARTRYEHETGGTTVDGMFVPTDDRSKTLIVGKYNRARLSEERGEAGWATRWKTPNGWVTLDATQMQSLGEAVDDHVQACFDREEELLNAVAAGTFTEAMLSEGWPG